MTGRSNVSTLDKAIEALKASRQAVDAMQGIDTQKVTIEAARKQLDAGNLDQWATTLTTALAQQRAERIRD